MTKTGIPGILFVFGSKSDQFYERIVTVVNDWSGEGSEYFTCVRYVSCHRDRKTGNWEELLRLVQEINIKVIIACAGKAAALPGAIAAEVSPDIKVIGVALPGKSLIDSLAAELSITQLPQMENRPEYAGMGEEGMKKAVEIALEHIKNYV